MTSDPRPLHVLLISEGTYPYYGGGISTWSHMLCERMEQVAYSLYSINAGYVDEPIFPIGPNIQNVIQVPLWAPDEPQDYVNYTNDYYKVVNKKERTTEAVITGHFLPLFSDFLDMVYQESHDMPKLDHTIRSMWAYFQKYDYKETMRSEVIWSLFKVKATEDITTGQQMASIFDITVGLRWLFRFFIPLSNSVLNDFNIRVRILAVGCIRQKYS